jgi:hypothetical protein
MTTFADSVELVASEEASIHKLFEGDTRVRGPSPEPRVQAQACWRRRCSSRTISRAAGPCTTSARR